MKLSIITITFNSAATLEATIQSVLSQDYPDIEYIIIDGKSTDATLEIVSKYQDKISKVISEKDQGLYDALNKGIGYCTGDVIGFLHSDDVYYDNTILSQIMQRFSKHPEAQGLYGDLIFVDRFDLNNTKRVWHSGNYVAGSFLNGWMPPHPTFFVRKEVYQRHGTFNTKLKHAADYELMLRFIHVNKIKLIYLPIIIVRMRMGGASNFSLKNKWEAHLEDREAWRLNGIKTNPLKLMMKPLSKVKQYFKRRH
jgi:glycosyltransferase involved in cell wall biosynthesis